MTRAAQAPGRHSAPQPDERLFGGPAPNTERPDFAAIQDSPEFAELRRRLRVFVFPVSALFLSWYLTFVLFAAYDHEFMGRRVFGLITVGILFGLAQFVSTVLITLAYNRYARRRLDPQVKLIRRQAGVDES